MATRYDIVIWYFSGSILHGHTFVGKWASILTVPAEVGAICTLKADSRAVVPASDIIGCFRPDPSFCVPVDGRTLKINFLIVEGSRNG